MENSLGKHFILEMYGCSFEILDNERELTLAFEKAVELSKMTLLKLSSHKFDPHGVTAVALLSESHMSIHTYPEFGYAAADIFTCGDEGSPQKAMEVLMEVIKPGSHSVIYIPRGLQVQDPQK